MGLGDTVFKIIKAVGVGIFVYSVVLIIAGFLFGFYMAGQNARFYEQYAVDTQEENNLLEVAIKSMDVERVDMEYDIALLEAQKKTLQESVNTLSGDNERLRKENSLLRTKNYELETYKTLYFAKSSYADTTISPSTPVQTAQITTPASTQTTYTQGTYRPYSMRPTTPFPSEFAQVTPNIQSFVNGKDFNGCVNGVRAIQYILHGETEGNNFIIQYADETLTKGKGDCTDKALLLYACLTAMGYDKNELYIAGISTCDGKYDHNVVLMTDPPGDKANWGHYSFTLQGTTYYMIDPTNWAGTPMNSGMSYYDECYRVGNIYSIGSTNLGGLDIVPIHGLKVEN